jgi:cell division protein FtsW (lipid II flippase)
MNKEDILEKSRKENKNKDIAELEVICQASKIAGRVGMLICCAIAILEIIFTGRPNFGTWTIYFSILATLMLVKYIKLHRKHELWIAVLYIACFVAFLAAYILKLAGVINL